METEHIKQYLYADCQRQVEEGAHYLVFQDTTQPNFERNRANISDTTGLGVIGDKKSLGFFLHPCLVVQATSGRCIGYSHVATWSRAEDQADKQERRYKKLPIQEKESYRWIKASLASKQVLQAAKQLTIICDREADIGELFEQVADENTHLLIRSKADRKLVGQSAKLYAYVQEQPLAGEFSLQVKGDERKNRQARKAHLQVRLARVGIESKAVKGKVMEVYAIEAREAAQTVPAGEAPILWRLLTTHGVEDFSQAIQLIEWYSLRWNIEQVFRLLKHKGMNVEMLDVERGKALIGLTLLALLAISKIMLLHLASKQEAPQPLAATFTAEQMACMQVLNKEYEGKTKKQQNPYPADSLQFCYWVIARLGGWKPHEKQAGVICLMRGYTRFQQLFQGWLLAKNVS